MVKTSYNKLVRDKIPKIIGEDDSVEGFSIKKVVSGEEIERYIQFKIDEEIFELRTAKKSDEIIEEVVDLMEVLFKLAQTHFVSREELLVKVAEKREERGGFDDNYILQFITKGK